MWLCLYFSKAHNAESFFPRLVNIFWLSLIWLIGQRWTKRYLIWHYTGCCKRKSIFIMLLIIIRLLKVYSNFIQEYCDLELIHLHWFILFVIALEIGTWKPLIYFIVWRCMHRKLYWFIWIQCRIFSWW